MPSAAEQTKAALDASRKVGRIVQMASDALERQLSRTKFDSVDSELKKINKILLDGMDDCIQVAHTFVKAQAHLPGWEPEYPDVSVLQRSILSDVRRNFRDYWFGPRLEEHRKKANLLLDLSLTTLLRQAYSDALLSAYSELEDRGYEVLKQWNANFVNNTPCDSCVKLHGQRLPLDKEFPFDGKHKHPVYGVLLGPPRHPRCKCYLSIIIVDPDVLIENEDYDEVVGDDIPRPSQSWSTEKIQSLPIRVFKKIMQGLRKFFKRRK